MKNEVREDVATHMSFNLDNSSAQVIGGREYNEDQVLIQKLKDGRYLFAIFDGHGGDRASIKARELFKEKMESAPTDLKKLQIYLGKIFLEVDRALFSMKFRYEGTTATLCVISSSEIVVAHVGDSPAIFINRRGNMAYTTVDHIPVRKSERERIENAGGWVSEDPWDVPRVNGCLAPSRSLGDFDLKTDTIESADLTKTAVSSEPTIAIWKYPRDGGMLALMSDGMCESPRGARSREEIVNFIWRRSGEDFSESAPRIVNEQAKLMKYLGDNVSLILVKT